MKPYNIYYGSTSLYNSRIIFHHKYITTKAVIKVTNCSRLATNIFAKIRLSYNNFPIIWLWTLKHDSIVDKPRNEAVATIIISIDYYIHVIIF